MNNPIRLRFIFAFATVVLLTAMSTVMDLSAREIPVYRVDVLGQATTVKAVNDHGNAVGWTSAGSVRAWVSKGDGTIELLPLPQGASGSQAFDINDEGSVVGFAGTSYSGVAVVWHPGASGYEVTELGALPGHTSSVATTINNVGDIVGYSVTPGWMGGPAVLFTDPGGIRNLVSLGFVAEPTDINDERQIIGGQLRMDLDTEVVEDLGVPNGSYRWTRGYSVNESGQVAGYVQVATSLPDDQKVARYTDGTGWDVLSAAGPYNNGYGINDRGDVSMELPNTVAVYLDGLGVYDLEDLLHPEEQGWLFITSFANDINNKGQIVTVGTNPSTGEGGVVLLTPYDTLVPSQFTLSAATGSSVDFSLAAGPDNANRGFLLVGSLSGTDLGTLLPGGLATIPLNRDWFTDYILARLNTTVFSNFWGTLDAIGKRAAQLNAPPIPTWVGQKIDFAYALNDPWNYVSHPVSVTVVP